MTKVVLAWYPRLVWLTTGGHCCPTGILKALCNLSRKCFDAFSSISNRRDTWRTNLYHLLSQYCKRPNRKKGLVPQDRTFNKLNSLCQKEGKTFQRWANSYPFISYLIMKQALSRWTRKVYLAKQNDIGELRQRKKARYTKFFLDVVISIKC